MEKWQAEGQPEARHVLRKKTQDLISDLPAPIDYEYLIAKGEEFNKLL